MIREVHVRGLEARIVTLEVARAHRTYVDLPREDGLACFETAMAALADLADDLCVLAPCGDDEADYRYLVYGSRVAEAAGLDMTGRRLSEFGGATVELFQDVTRAALTQRLPVYARFRALYSIEVVFWERICLPCRTAEGSLRLITVLRPIVERRDFLNAILEASTDGILSLRIVRDEADEPVDALVVTANAQAADYAGHPTWALVEGRLLELFPAFQRNGVWALCRKVLETGAPERFEVEIGHRRKDTWLRVTVARIDRDGLVMSMSDVTDLKYALFEAECVSQELASEVKRRRELESDLRRLSQTDELTGVLNRRGFGEAARVQTAQARRYGHPLTVVAVDIDHFKRVNDVHGHAAGDMVLMAVAALFVELTRKDVDIIGRVGGEEFMLLLPHTPLEGAIRLAERIRQRIMASVVETEGAVVTVTASFGVRTFDPARDFEKTLIEADDALYRAKSEGRNRVVSFTDAPAVTA